MLHSPVHSCNPPVRFPNSASHFAPHRPTALPAGRRRAGHGQDRRRVRLFRAPTSSHIQKVK
jgi:hypothetical protein